MSILQNCDLLTYSLTHLMTFLFQGITERSSAIQNNCRKCILFNLLISLKDHIRRLRPSDSLETKEKICFVNSRADKTGAPRQVRCRCSPHSPAPPRPAPHMCGDNSPLPSKTQHSPGRLPARGAAQSGRETGELWLCGRLQVGQKSQGYSSGGAGCVLVLRRCCCWLGRVGGGSQHRHPPHPARTPCCCCQSILAGLAAPLGQRPNFISCEAGPPPPPPPLYTAGPASHWTTRLHTPIMRGRASTSQS